MTAAEARMGETLQKSQQTVGMSNCTLSWQAAFCLLSFPFSDESPYTHKSFKGSLIKSPQTFIYKSREKDVFVMKKNL